MVEAPSMHSAIVLAPDFTPAELSNALAAIPAQIVEATASSRDARRGACFLAYRGATRDGRDFIEDAIVRGASAVLYDPANFEWKSGWKVPSLAVPNLKTHASQIAGHIYGHPSDALWMTGVTGTNGKTSVAQWIAQGLERAGRKSAVLGTIGNGLVGNNSNLQPSDNTTPDAVALQRQLREYVTQGAVACAMEVSSHGLDQGRVADIKYDVAVYTNLTRDHLDYHGTMAAYGEAKAKLFAKDNLKHAVINADDAFGQQLIERLNSTGKHGVNLIRTSTRQNGHHADLVAEQLSVSAAGLAFEIGGKFGRANVESDILGAFNVANLLSVIGTLLVSGVSLEQAAAIACELPPVPGRMQTVRSSDRNKPLVVVDYAHTPDALEKALSTIAAIVPENGRLISVFGCGGDRDRGKRPQMGAISARYADLSIVTSDNPRTENPQRIIEDIESGMKGARLKSISDRHQAIFEALNEAKTGDIVVIAGKGHEDYQIVGETKHHFSDIEVAQEALDAWHGVSR